MKSCSRKVFISVPNNWSQGEKTPEGKQSWLLLWKLAEIVEAETLFMSFELKANGDILDDEMM